MRVHLISVFVVSAALATGAAYADGKSGGAAHSDDKVQDKRGDNGHGGGHGDGTGRGHGDSDGHGDAGGGRHLDDEDETTGDGDGGAPVADPQRTAAQAEFRQKLVEREHALIKELASHPGKKVSMGERQLIGVHWRHVMRLLRIRELADRAKDAAALKRVDALLAKADARLRTKIANVEAGGAK